MALHFFQSGTESDAAVPREPSPYHPSSDATGTNGVAGREEIRSSSQRPADEEYALLAARLGLPFLRGDLDPSRIVIRDEPGVAIQKLPLVSRYLDEDAAERLLLAPPLDRLSVVERVLAKRPDIRPFLLITTPDRLRKAVVSKLSVPIADNAYAALYMTNPAMSARHAVTKQQIAVLAAMLPGVATWFVIAPGMVLNAAHILFSLFFLSCAILRLLAARAPEQGYAEVADDRNDTGLPVYSVLVACYREALMAEQIVREMSALDWPAHRLEIKLVCEEDDVDTVSAFEALCLSTPFEILRVPVRGPRTKPKALNFALACCSGDYIVIYDAEDRPHPRQLREAWSVFRNAPDDLACLQAPLNITNGDAGWLSRMFAFEYAALFRGLLPYLASRQRLLPLGGTSNHFRRGALVAVGGWDPYNVTEDADLGVRLRRFGYRAGILTLPTLEEAPEDFASWRNQRTRWFKGWIQSSLVHMRAPHMLRYGLGGRDFIVFQILFTGHIGSTLVHPLMFALVGWQLVASFIDGSSSVLSQMLAAIDTGSVFLGYLAFAALADRIEHRGKGWSRLAMVCSLPVYWTFQAIAALAACREFCTDPHKWRKTPHRPVDAGPVPQAEPEIMFRASPARRRWLCLVRR